jgi:predicted transglutaminase-like cysteine proteinase
MRDPSFMGSGLERLVGRPSRRRLLAWLGAAGVAGLSPKPAFAAAEDPSLPPLAIPDLFGSAETAVGDPRRYLPKSRVLERAFAPARPLMEASVGPAAIRWERLMGELARRSPEAQILAVDRFANAIEWVEDARLYGQADYWATPAEFLGAGAGDCEDFAIAKYVALSRLGFAEERLRIALVYDRRRRLEHALTIVYWDGDALVLDSLSDAPRSHAEVTRYRPICSFNRRQLWVHRPA